MPRPGVRPSNSCRQDASFVGPGFVSYNARMVRYTQLAFSAFPCFVYFLHFKISRSPFLTLTFCSFLHDSRHGMLAPISEEIWCDELLNVVTLLPGYLVVSFAT